MSPREHSAPSHTHTAMWIHLCVQCRVKFINQMNRNGYGCNKTFRLLCIQNELASVSECHYGHSIQVAAQSDTPTTSFNCKLIRFIEPAFARLKLHCCAFRIKRRIQLWKMKWASVFAWTRKWNKFRRLPVVAKYRIRYIHSSNCSRYNFVVLLCTPFSKTALTRLIKIKTKY